MKKILIGVLAVILISLFKETTVSEKIIPDEAIRFRILANSNSTYDQGIKEKVSSELQNTMYNTLKDTQTVDEARNVIKDNINSFSNTVNNVLEEEDYNLSYNIDFGTHYFPKKEYKGITYDDGNYESLLVKLGSGKGDNWWCVLFPPLCLLEAEESSDVEYKFFVQELIDKFF
jgi:stage II sporulation protein R